MVAIGPGTMVLMGDPEEDEGKGLPKSVLDLKSAFEAGKVAEAGRILRRMWRSFPVGEPASPLLLLLAAAAFCAAELAARCGGRRAAGRC
ncbi:MAG: hypothetical protein R3E96_09795 [Planctomycetota bacterium]